MIRLTDILNESVLDNIGLKYSDRLTESSFVRAHKVPEIKAWRAYIRNIYPQVASSKKVYDRIYRGLGNIINDGSTIYQVTGFDESKAPKDIEITNVKTGNIEWIGIGTLIKWHMNTYK